MTETRPREHAALIADKVTALIRELLKDVPEKDRVAVVDLTLSWICIEWNLKKAQSKRKG